MYYTSANRSSGMKFMAAFGYNLKKHDGKLIIPIGDLDLFEPFMFFVRGMQKIGHEQRGTGNQNYMYDMSRLSKGVKCALQGCKSKL